MRNYSRGRRARRHLFGGWRGAGSAGTRHACALVFIVAASLPRVASAQVTGDPAVEAQWFTGSLEAPSPALPKAGILSVEPYAIYTANTGAYNSSWGHYSVPHDLNQVESLTLLKYGITDQLSIEALPSFAHSWNDLTTSSLVGLGDLPVELEYRFNEMNRKTGAPSLTVDLGMTFPTGDYDRLSRPLDGLGAGAFTMKEGFLLQSLFDTWGDHPLRLRFYGAIREAVADVSVQGVSVYGTAQGFHGQAAPGSSEDLGLGVEYGLNQRWVLAVDLVQNFANGYRLNGTDAVGAAVQMNAPSSISFALAPAIECNFSPSVGIIAGVEFSAAGRNISSYIAPQIALNIVF